MRARDILSEAIDTSGIDRQARVLLQRVLEQHIEKEWREFIEAFQPKGDIHDQYDAFFQYWSDEHREGSGDATSSARAESP